MVARRVALSKKVEEVQGKLDAEVRENMQVMSPPPPPQEAAGEKAMTANDEFPARCGVSSISGSWGNKAWALPGVDVPGAMPCCASWLWLLPTLHRGFMLHTDKPADARGPRWSGR